MVLMSLAATSVPESAAQMPLLLWLLVGVVGFVIGAVCVFISVSSIPRATISASMRLHYQSDLDAEDATLVAS